MNKLCLILEGGGVKCAYQSGVLKALQLAGYRFKGIGGTSFGSLNGAMYIESKSKKVEEFWSNIKPSTMFNEEELDDLMEKIYHNESILTKDNVTLIASKWKNFPKKYNEVSTMYHDLIRKSINEDIIRKSKVDFGLVTVTLPSLSQVLIKGGLALLNPADIILKAFFDKSDKFNKLELKPIEIAKSDIPQGKLCDYVIASSSIPPFKPIVIDKVMYIDGGFYDNLPIKLMSTLGYKKFLVIRTNTNDVSDKFNSDFDIKYITPSKDLGSCAMFSKSNIDDLRRLGYRDALSFINQDKKKSLIWNIKRIFIKKELF